MSDEVLKVNLESLRVREIEELEELLDSPIDVVFGEGRPRGKALRAIGYVVKKRDNPDFTWDDAGELLIEISDDAVDPQKAAG